jgi:hypothetical protein
MPIYSIPFNILDAFTLAYFKEHGIPFTTEHYNEALHQYNLQSEWGRLGIVRLKMVSEEDTDLFFSQAYLVQDDEVQQFQNSFNRLQKRKYIEGEQKKRPNAPIETLVKESNNNSDFDYQSVYPDFQEIDHEDLLKLMESPTPEKDLGIIFSRLLESQVPEKEFGMKISQLFNSKVKNYLQQKRNNTNAEIYSGFCRSLVAEHPLSTNTENKTAEIETTKIYEKTGRKELSGNELKKRLDLARQAENLRKEHPEMTWREIAKKINWHLGTRKAGIKLLEDARYRLKREQQQGNSSEGNEEN